MILKNSIVLINVLKNTIQFVVKRIELIEMSVKCVNKKILSNLKESVRKKLNVINVNEIQQNGFVDQILKIIEMYVKWDVHEWLKDIMVNVNVLIKMIQFVVKIIKLIKIHVI